MYKIALTQRGHYALMSHDGRTVHLFYSEFAAQTACDAMNRSNYEPTQDPYRVAAGRWDEKGKEAAA